MKKIQKIGGLLLAGLLSLGAVGVGCAPRGGGDDEMPAGFENATKLRVGNMNAGLGDTWLYAVAEEFQKEYADTVFEDGKQGVYVEITNKDSEFSTANLIQNMPHDVFDVYVLANAAYETMDSANILADMTSIMTAKNYDAEGNLVEDGTGTTSIADRMVPLYQNLYNLGTAETPRYSGVPFHATPVGITYDADLFSTKKLYLNAAGKFSANADDVAAGRCAPGPDGELGTSDDGLPATYEEFKNLCATMVTRSVTPFVWDAMHTYQRLNFFKSIWANYEGENDYMLNYSLNGHDNDLNVDVTERNGYELMKQPGRLAAYTMIHDIFANRWFYADSMKGQLTHIGAENVYINSSKQNKPIAFLIEGGWWENECREKFDVMEGKYGANYGYGRRNFKYMPLPRFTGTSGIADQQNTKQVLTTTTGGNSGIYINKATKKMNVAEEFIKYIHSREILSLMSQVSSCLRPFEYTMTADELAKATPYFNSVYTLWKDTARVEMAYDLATSTLLSGNASYFGNWYQMGEPFDTFYGNSDKTALSLYNDQVAAYRQTDSIWSTGK